MLLIDPAANEDFEDLIKNNEETNAVVIGLAPDKFHYEELTKAFRCILITWYNKSQKIYNSTLIMRNKLFLISDRY